MCAFGAVDAVDAVDADLEAYRPSEEHATSHMLVEWSKKIAWSSQGTVYEHVDLGDAEL